MSEIAYELILADGAGVWALLVNVDNMIRSIDNIRSILLPRIKKGVLERSSMDRTGQERSADGDTMSWEDNRATYERQAQPCSRQSARDPWRQRGKQFRRLRGSTAWRLSACRTRGCACATTHVLPQASCLLVTCSQTQSQLCSSSFISCRCHSVPPKSKVVKRTLPMLSSSEAVHQVSYAMGAVGLVVVAY